MTAPEPDTLSPRERAVNVGVAGHGNVGGDNIAFYVAGWRRAKPCVAWSGKDADHKTGGPRYQLHRNGKG